MPRFHTVNADVAAFDKQAKPAFLGFWQERESLIMDELGGVVEKFPTDGPSEKYPFFGAVPLLQKYSGDNFPIFDLSQFSVTVENEQYGGAIAIDLIEFEDLDRMPGARDSLLRHVAGGLARISQLLIEKLISSVLLEEDDFSAMASPDGKSTGFFLAAGSGHFEDNVINKAPTNSGFDLENLRDDDKTVRKLFAAMNDTEGNPVRGRAPRRMVILCDPEHEDVYMELYRAKFLPRDVVSADGGAGIDNIRVPGGPLGLEVRVIGWAYLIGKSKTFYIDVTGEVPGPKAVLWQEHVKAPFGLVSNLAQGSEQETIFQEIVYKNRGRVGFHMGDPRKAILVPK